MVKCKRCKDGRDYIWDRTHNESTGKWRLWDSERERPHECGKKKEDTESFMTKHDRKLWKTSWKPEMDEKSFILCGVCNDGTECIVVSDCPECEKFSLNPCKHWCPKCNDHPMVSLHARNKMARLEDVS
jgi:hypothetical protein